MKAGLLVDIYLFNIFCTYYLGGSLQVLNTYIQQCIYTYAQQCAYLQR